jgi:hypothetical protein
MPRRSGKTRSGRHRAGPRQGDAGACRCRPPGRADEDWFGEDERQFLTALRSIAESGRTPAEEKLDLFHGRWRGSVDPIFAEFAY